jgi:hypothetical protein
VVVLTQQTQAEHHGNFSERPSLKASELTLFSSRPPNQGVVIIIISAFDQQLIVSKEVQIA